MKKERYLELTEVALKVCRVLERNKVEGSEGCLVKKITEDMWNKSREKDTNSITYPIEINGTSYGTVSATV